MARLSRLEYKEVSGTRMAPWIRQTIVLIGVIVLGILVSVSMNA